MNAASSYDPPEHGTAPKPRQTLLVVEDEVLARFAVCGVLRDAGFTVLEAAAAEEAKAVLRAVAVDLLFVDVHLYGSGGGGLEVARFARELRPEAKLVLTSGKVGPEEIPGLGGIGPFIPKPYLFSRVIRVVRSLLAGEGADGSEQG